MKKIKTDSKKLVLATQTIHTIRQLRERDLQPVNGAGPWTYSRCYCN